jgi:hypothetical protein
VEAPTHTVFTWPDIWLPVGVPRGDKDKAAEAASHDAAVAAVTAAAAQVGFLSPRGGAAAQPQPTVIPNLAAVPNTARSVRAAIEAVLGLVAAVQAGASLSTGVIAMVPGADGEAGGDSGSVRGGGRAGGTERPGTQASAAYASSNFSYGSDLLKASSWMAFQIDHGIALHTRDLSTLLAAATEGLHPAAGSVRMSGCVTRCVVCAGDVV